MKKIIVIMLLILIISIGFIIGYNVYSLYNKPSSIKIVSTSQKTIYYEGEKLNIDNLVVELYSKKKKLGIISNDDLSIIGYDSLSIGKQKITVMYDNFKDYYYVEVQKWPEENPTKESIEMHKLPNKLNYLVGEKLDTTGGVLKINYSNGDYDLVELMPLMTSGFDSSTPGVIEIRVDYVGFTTYFEIEVIANDAND